ncbi:rRNA maturation RNase YbeY [Segetibacter sp.]|jgi:probable rRNA maturation factor|uniref:rRNA maturation RNase YbeY n=1 Tax=Segetibacter sp. TaxID=2231182 RepID=UPI0026185770|nr:rRNA maturation RNase YbeY [Segetibacter sp.]MCW3081104.1 metal-dependent hydrolase YbeY [Segetibacter sp.]
MPLVRFCYADVPVLAIRSKKAVKEFIVAIFQAEGKALSDVTYIFCSDQYLLQINKTFLQHDYYTDIVSFDLSEGSQTIGEIYISVDRVKENAVTHATEFKKEMLRVIFHGALHLVGYKDKRKSEITNMREKEEHYLRLFGQK